MSYGSKAAERIANKVVMITGASSGIGEATAKEIASAANGNLKLVLCARRKEKLENLSKELTKEHSSLKVHIGQLDVSKLETIKPFVANLPKEFSDVDVLVNNAGLALGKDEIGTIETEDMLDMFQTNVLGLFMMTQAVLPIMKAKNSGDIVNIGSVAGRDSYPGGGIYCPTKASVKSFSQVLRRELINTKIRILEVDPGNVETEFSNVRFKGNSEKAKLVYAGTEPLLSEDVAEIIVFGLTRKQKTVIAETLVFSTNQASAFHLYRESDK